MNKLKEIFNDEVSILMIIVMILSVIQLIQFIFNIKLQRQINELRDNGIQIALTYRDKFESA